MLLKAGSGEGGLDGSNMYRAGLSLCLIVLSACSSMPAQQGGTIVDNRMTYTAASEDCRTAGKFAIIRYIDQVTRMITFVCADKP